MSNILRKFLWTDTSAAASSNWFASAVTVHDSVPTVHIIQTHLASVSSIVKLNVAQGGVSKTLQLNGGAVIPPNTAYNEAVVFVPGSTYNIVHNTGNQQIGCIILESDEMITL